MSFSCFDSSGNPITTANYLDCNPALDLKMTASEFATLKEAIVNAGNSNLTVAELFAIPSSLDLSTLFWLGFSMPVYLYIIAFLIGSVVNFISQR